MAYARFWFIITEASECKARTCFPLPFKLEMNQPQVQKAIVVSLVFLACPVCRKVKRISRLVIIPINAARVAYGVHICTDCSEE